ncbi:hypothetical protein PCIT_a2608 [Pseudoalteromonas citrea]|uniref:MAPEG family protein n=2 Tax=Pseudoalteromonas citrea TaxID=43655 RepID=A0AAD4FRB7_9GAMM|nr:MAPEG family protein [Pseudoalteromonas citrea]KAF7769717.1 hypothetical protein PCIT_a2608 [Pseudoalteromonas citrea]
MWIHYPLAFLVALIGFLWLFTMVQRIVAFRSKQISVVDIMFVSKHKLPIRTVLSGNNYDNQFQQPILFIVLLHGLYLQSVSGQFWYVLSAMFVISRYWHCAEHIFTQHLLRRTIAFVIGSLCLFIGWFKYVHILHSASL